VKLADARRLAAPTPRDLEIAAEIKANGGSTTAEELAFTRVWDRFARTWTGHSARSWAAREEAKTGIPCVGLPDGAVYRLREEYREAGRG
jgi:hypothetical protein